MSMTRAEALAWVFKAAEKWVISRECWGIRAEGRAPIAERAALAEATAAFTGSDTQAPPIEAKAALVESKDEVAEMPEWQRRLAPTLHPDYVTPSLTLSQHPLRCQHQAADATLDCTEPAVLCEHHSLCESQQDERLRIAEEQYAAGKAAARDEIARALEAESERHRTSVVAPFHGVLGRAARCIRDGSIREWLPKEGK